MSETSERWVVIAVGNESYDGGDEWSGLKVFGPFASLDQADAFGKLLPHAGPEGFVWKVERLGRPPEITTAPLRPDADLFHILMCITSVYEDVASGKSRGAGGHFYADGKGTLHAVTIPVEFLERLAAVLGRPVHGRTYDDRNA